MIVKELIELLQQAPQTAEVRIAYDSGYAYGDCNLVEIESEEVVYVSTASDANDDE